MHNFRHNLDLIDEEVVCFTFDPFAVNDFDGVVLVRVFSQVSIVDCAVLTAA